jgi:hypothetical protein
MPTTTETNTPTPSPAPTEVKPAPTPAPARCSVTACTGTASAFSYFIGKQPERGVLSDKHDTFNLCAAHQENVLAGLLAALTVKEAKALFARAGITTTEA